MRIAIVSTGLEHVARGIEVWADSMAVALAAKHYDFSRGTCFRGDLLSGGMKVFFDDGIRQIEIMVRQMVGRQING